MSMNVGNASGEGEVMVEMNTTPLIDVMLVLLTLLIITLPIQTHAVKLDMPNAAAIPPTVIPDTVELGVDFDGTISWNGAQKDRRQSGTQITDSHNKTSHRSSQKGKRAGVPHAFHSRPCPSQPSYTGQSR